MKNQKLQQKLAQKSQYHESQQLKAHLQLSEIQKKRKLITKLQNDRLQKLKEEHQKELYEK